MGQEPRTFWGYWRGTVTRPAATLESLGRDTRALDKGIAALGVVLIAYTGILAVFIAQEYPAMAPSVLPLSVDQQYGYQIWYQGPLFVAMTAVLAMSLRLITRRRPHPVPFAGLFAQVSFATTVPFALTTMLVELVIAAMVLTEVVTPSQTLEWLAGQGSWFATIYQAGGILWLVALLCLVSRSAAKTGWPLSILLGVALGVAYGLPIGLFIR